MPDLPTSPPGLYLGFDYGQKRIGIARGHTFNGEAAPLDTVTNHSGTPDWTRIETLVSDWQPVGLVVGIPLTETGEEQPMTLEARGFARRLQQRFDLPVHLADERFSSMDAQQQFREQRQAGKRGRTSKSEIDRIAAAVILTRWFNQLSDPDDHI